jgi:hypothetical protein
MATPWKFLARLVSPRRQKKQDDRSIKDIKPNALAVWAPTETPLEKNFADRSADENVHPVIQADLDFAKPEPQAKPSSFIRGMGERDSEGEAESSDLPLPDTGASNPSVAQAKRRGRAKRVEAVAAVSPKPPVVYTISAELSLDEEIKVLRGQLARKLRLQNAQLRKMLERFAR